MDDTLQKWNILATKMRADQSSPMCWATTKASHFLWAAEYASRTRKNHGPEASHATGGEVYVDHDRDIGARPSMVHERLDLQTNSTSSCTASRTHQQWWRLLHRPTKTQETKQKRQSKRLQHQACSRWGHIDQKAPQARAEVSRDSSLDPRDNKGKCSQETQKTSKQRWRVRRIHWFQK